MKKVFNFEYPTENIEAIEKWLRDKLLKEDGMTDIGYDATIIVEIVEEDN